MRCDLRTPPSPFVSGSIILAGAVPGFEYLWAKAPLVFSLHPPPKKRTDRWRFLSARPEAQAD